MKITRTVTVDGISVDLTIELTEEELKQAHRTYQSHLEAKAAALDLLSTPMSPFMQDVLAGDPHLSDDAVEVDPSWVRAYVRERFATDFALNDEEETADA